MWHIVEVEEDNEHDEVIKLGLREDDLKVNYVNLFIRYHFIISCF